MLASCAKMKQSMEKMLNSLESDGFEVVEFDPFKILIMANSPLLDFYESRDGSLTHKQK